MGGLPKEAPTNRASLPQSPDVGECDPCQSFSADRILICEGFFALLHVFSYFCTLQDVLTHEFPHHLHAACHSVLEFMVYFGVTHTEIPYGGHNIYLALQVVLSLLIVVLYIIWQNICKKAMSGT